LHMMYDKMAPELPIKAPTIVIKLLFNMKPSAQRAQPEYEFRTVMTTGMSAPPMAAVRVTGGKMICQSLKGRTRSWDSPPIAVDMAAVAPSHPKPPIKVGSMKKAAIAPTLPAKRPAKRPNFRQKLKDSSFYKLTIEHMTSWQQQRC
jgi:hypothetical protein